MSRRRERPHAHARRHSGLRDGAADVLQPMETCTHTGRRIAIPTRNDNDFSGREPSGDTAAALLQFTLLHRIDLARGRRRTGPTPEAED
jgi:hypothetical protein